MIRPTLIDLNPDELHNHPFMISLDRYNGSCNTFDGLNGRICVMSKTRVIDLKVFLMRTLKNTLESYLKENIYIYIIVNNLIYNKNVIAININAIVRVIKISSIKRRFCLQSQDMCLWMYYKYCEVDEYFKTRLKNSLCAC